MHLTDFEHLSPALPCADGLIAGTLALMTCWASLEPSATATEGQQRALMARKIASNLLFLREHPDLAPGLRRVIDKVHVRWLLIAQTEPVAAPTQTRPNATALH